MLEDERQPTGDRERSVDRAHAVVRAFVRAATSAAGEDPRALVELLRRTLPAHFAYEERADGFFDRLEGSGASVLLTDRLRGEHREFLATLTRLEENLARGEEVTGDLQVMAGRLREHEWIESMTAAQRGLAAPTDPALDLAPAGRALDEATATAVEQVADRCRAIASESSMGDLLAAISVAVPDTVPVEGVLARLEHALEERGLDFVEVAPCAGAEIRLCGARFRRPRVGNYLRSNFSIR